MSTITTYYNLIKPGVNDPTDQDLWGGYLNDDLDIIDQTLHDIATATPDFPVGAGMDYWGASAPTGWISLMVSQLRIRQWIKNALVLFPLVFSDNLTHFDKVRGAIGAMVLFSFLTSAVYILNDIVDRVVDRQHPTKRTVAASERRRGFIVMEVFE